MSNLNTVTPDYCTGVSEFMQLTLLWSHTCQIRQGRWCSSIIAGGLFNIYHSPYGHCPTMVRLYIGTAGKTHTCPMTTQQSLICARQKTWWSMLLYWPTIVIPCLFAVLINHLPHYHWYMHTCVLLSVSVWRIFPSRASPHSTTCTPRVMNIPSIYFPILYDYHIYHLSV